LLEVSLNDLDNKEEGKIDLSKTPDTMEGLCRGHFQSSNLMG